MRTPDCCTSRLGIFRPRLSGTRRSDRDIDIPKGQQEIRVVSRLHEFGDPPELFRCAPHPQGRLWWWRHFSALGTLSWGSTTKRWPPGREAGRRGREEGHGERRETLEALEMLPPGRWNFLRVYKGENSMRLRG